jgi:hypothetical protein
MNKALEVATKTAVTLAIVGGISAGAGLGWAKYAKAKTKVPTQAELPAGYKTASYDFLKAYDEYMGKIKEIRCDNLSTEKMQREERYLTGLEQELMREIPPGFTFDNKARGFKPAVVQPAAPSEKK